MSTLEQTRPAPEKRRRGPLRRVVVGLVVLVVLAAVLLGAAGWYYSGQIGGEALAAHPEQSVTYDLVVASFDGATVVLRRTDGASAKDALRTADVTGLDWAGGRGIVSGPAQVRDDGRVARALKLLPGSAAPTAGTEARLVQNVWTDPGQAYGVPYSDVTYPCAGGSCPAWFVPGRSGTWLVEVHGKGATREETLRAAGPAVRAGMPVLDIAYRNDLQAPRDPSDRYGYGATEWRDLESAVGYARDHGATRVVLFGDSMGGSIVAGFLEHSRAASAVTGVVLDAPALDLRSTVTFEAGERTLPGIGTSIPGVLTDTAEWMAGWRYGLDWDAVDYLHGDWLKVPALVFHGTADETVPIATSDELAKAHPDLVQEVRVPGAAHVGSWNVDPAAYSAKESAFLACVSGTATAGCSR